MSAQRRWTDQQLVEAVRESRTAAEVIRRLGLSKARTAYRHVQEHIAKLGIDTAHFDGQGWARGKSFPERRATPLGEVLVPNRKVNTHGLKLRLIRLGLKKHECEECGRVRWRGKPIPIELDHINGDPLDNRIENLRILCANCHAQTPTYSGRNRKKKSGLAPLPSLPPRLRGSRSKGSWPSADVLRALVQQKPVRLIAKEIGVTDVAVKKHCKGLGIQTPTRGYWAKVRAMSTPP